MKLQNQIQLDIPVSEMQDGQIGVITSWLHENYVGRIIQRHNDRLVTLQRKYLESFSAITDSEKCRVRILQKGEVLIIE